MVDGSGGVAIIAVRTTSVDNLGHVGVGFQNADGTWTIGAIEGDPEKAILWGAAALPLIGNNGGWVETGKTLLEAEVLFHALGYDGFKIIQVSDSNPDLAEFVTNDFPMRGYNVVNNNCLSATIDVLTAYGAKNLPLQIAHVAPNDYYANVKGEEYLWDSGKKTYTNLNNGLPLVNNYKADPEKALKEWQTASWIGSNGGASIASASDVDPGTYSSAGSDLPCI